MSRSLAGTWLTRLPSISSSPSLIDSSPATMRKVVDLPQPDGPSSTMNSPCATSSRHGVHGEVFPAWVLLRKASKGHGGHYFTAPAVMPWISFSEKKM